MDQAGGVVHDVAVYFGIVTTLYQMKNQLIENQLVFFVLRVLNSENQPTNLPTLNLQPALSFLNSFAGLDRGTFLCSSFPLRLRNNSSYAILRLSISQSAKNRLYKMEKIKKEKLAPAWFHIWFVLSCLLLFIGGIIDGAEGEDLAGFNPWGAALGMFVMYIMILVVWKYSFLISWVSRLQMPLVILSVFSGWLFAEIDELVNYPFNPLVPGITLTEDILLTTPMYIGAHLMWFWVLRRYRFTVFQALLTGGFSLGIYEFILGTPSPIAVFIFPFMIMIHGVHMVIPKIALNEQFENISLKETKMKYVFGVMLPALGTGLGILVAILFAS